MNVKNIHETLFFAMTEENWVIQIVSRSPNINEPTYVKQAMYRRRKVYEFF